MFWRKKQDEKLNPCDKSFEERRELRTEPVSGEDTVPVEPEAEVLPKGVDRETYEEVYWYEEHSPGYAEKRQCFEEHRRLAPETLTFAMETDDLAHFSVREQLHTCGIYPFLKYMVGLQEIFDGCAENISIELDADARLEAFTDSAGDYESNNNFLLEMTGSRRPEGGYRLDCRFMINPEDAPEEAAP